MRNLSSAILVELMINTLSEFIERIFQKRKKTDSEKLNELNSKLKTQFDFSLFDISKNSSETLLNNLEKLDLIQIDEIIFSLFKISKSNSDQEFFQKFKSNSKLNERIMEIIIFTENNFNKLSLESSNIKNSLQHLVSVATFISPPLEYLKILFNVTVGIIFASMKS